MNFIKGQKVWFLIVFTPVHRGNSRIGFGEFIEVKDDICTITEISTRKRGGGKYGFTWLAEAEDVFDNEEDAKRRLIHLSLTA